jgi:hypothetical protein
MVEYIYIKQVSMSIVTLLVPYSFLVFYTRSIEKSLTIYLSTFLLPFITYSFLQNDRLNILIYLALYIFIIIIYKSKSSRRNKMKINDIKLSDLFYILIIIVLSILSYFIPITQNWDFYTFYYQVIYSSVAHSITPLFNNIQLVILVSLKDFGILPRIVAIFFLVNFLLLLYNYFEKNIIFPLLIITNISIYISLINENSYLELSSLTVLILFLINYYRYGFSDIYTKLSALLLFFTKGNLSFVIGPYVNMILLIQTIIDIFKKNKKNFIYNLMYLCLFGLTTLYFINNYIKYFAINFEVFFMFQYLTLKGLNSTAWFSIASGDTQMPLSQIISIKLFNLLNPIYDLFIPFSIFILVKNYIKSKITNLHLSNFEIGLLSVYVIYIISPYFPATNTFSNIFTIRYYIFFIFLIYLIFLKKINTNYTPFFYILAFISLFFFSINIIISGPFMKENLILNYLNNLYVYHMLSIGLLLSLSYFAKLNKTTSKINYSFQLILYIFIIIIMIVILSFIFPLIINAYSLKFFTDSTQFNCLIHDIFPKLYSAYYVSYCENDLILINISYVCHYVYSIGGIYAPSALYISNVTLLIRAGHISYLPFMLTDIKLENSSIYYYIINRYPYLKAFELPSNFCFQIVSPNHKEYNIMKMINVLNKISRSFSIIYNIINHSKPLKIYHYYTIYNVTNPLDNS